MKITKFGHSCMLAEEGEARILIDPGKWSGTKQNEVKNLDVILITHEHPDHLDPESLKLIIQNNPSVKIYTNKGVGKILSENEIAFEFLENGQSATIKNVSIEAFGEKHVFAHEIIPVVDDTGYLIQNRFFYAGDAFHLPNKPVEILAETMYAPWATFQEMMDHAQKIKPKIIFPVHDAIYKFTPPLYKYAEQILKPLGIEFKILNEGQEYDFL